MWTLPSVVVGENEMVWSCVSMVVLRSNVCAIFVLFGEFFLHAEDVAAVLVNEGCYVLYVSASASGHSDFAVFENPDRYAP